MAARRIDRSPGLWVAVALTLGLLAAACGGGGDGQPSVAVEPAGTTEAAAPADGGDTGGTTAETTATAAPDPETAEGQELLVAPVDTTHRRPDPLQQPGPDLAEPAVAELGDH